MTALEAQHHSQHPSKLQRNYWALQQSLNPHGVRIGRC